MRIRSITYFVSPGWPLDQQAIRQAGEFLKLARPAFTDAGFEVQSVRLATTPFPQVLGADRLTEAVHFAQELEARCLEAGIDYVSLGPALPDMLASYALIPEILLGTQSVFASGSMGFPGGRISLPAVRACAQVIFQAARISPDGFGNLRFTALSNVSAGSPFFPAAYHEGSQPCFALATEAADLAVQAFSSADGLNDARDRLVQTIGDHARRLEKVSTTLSDRSGTACGGIDFTLAPFPEPLLSSGTALERVGVPAVGMAGSLAAAAILAEAIDRAQFSRTGFSGLMFPVLEDSTLARRAAEGLLTVNELLLYSAVCGTGLDTVPLPGDTTPAQLEALLLDLAALGTRLDKPLTARLMPIPGKSSRRAHRVRIRLLCEQPGPAADGRAAAGRALRFGDLRAEVQAVLCRVRRINRLLAGRARSNPDCPFSWR